MGYTVRLNSFDLPAPSVKSTKVVKLSALTSVALRPLSGGVLTTREDPYMPVPRCPICGCEAADLSQPEAHSVAQSTEKSDARVVICHCIENHRFVVPLEERFQKECRRLSRAS